MISAVDFAVFVTVALFSAVASVSARKTLYAVLWQVQTAAAVSGLMVCLNARFIAFALLSTAVSVFLTFLTFALIIFDASKREGDSEKGKGAFFAAMVVLPAAECAWLFSRLPSGEGALASGDFSFAALGMLLYSHYAVCLIAAALVLTGTMVGVTTLMMNKKDDARAHVLSDPVEGKTELRRLPVERRSL